MHLSLNGSSFAHYCGCVVNGGGAMAAMWVLLLLLNTSEPSIFYDLIHFLVGGGVTGKEYKLSAVSVQVISSYQMQYLILWILNSMRPTIR